MLTPTFMVINREENENKQGRRHTKAEVYILHTTIDGEGIMRLSGVLFRSSSVLLKYYFQF